MKVLMCFLGLLLFMEYGSCLNEKQMKSAGKLLRNSCQPKSKTTDELIDNMHKGKWDEDQTAKCYMLCIMTMAKLVQKSGEYDKESALGQIPQLPEGRQEPTKKTMENCDGKQSGAEKCELAWSLAKCMYMDNPDNYFLP